MEPRDSAEALLDLEIERVESSVLGAHFGVQELCVTTTKTEQGIAPLDLVQQHSSQLSTSTEQGVAPLDLVQQHPPQVLTSEAASILSRCDPRLAQTVLQDGITFAVDLAGMIEADLEAYLRTNSC